MICRLCNNCWNEIEMGVWKWDCRMSFEDFSRQFTHLDLVHIGPDDWMNEPALHSKKPWRAVLARRRWRSGYNAGGGPFYLGSYLTIDLIHMHLHPFHQILFIQFDWIWKKNGFHSLYQPVILRYRNDSRMKLLIAWLLNSIDFVLNFISLSK